MNDQRRFFISVIAIQKGLLIAYGVFGVWLAASETTFEFAVSAWDSFHYLHLARDGYHHGDRSCAFYPLFPLLMRWTAPILGGSYLWAGLLISNLAGIAGLYLFYRYAWEQHGKEVARMALLGLLVFPTAIFFSLIYTESLFFLEWMVAFWALRKDRVGLAAASGFLMPLTRAVGLFIVFVFLWHWFEQCRLQADKNAAEVKNPNRWLIAAACAILGSLTYFGLMWLWTGNPLEGFDAQKSYTYAPSVGNIFNVKKWGTVFLHWGSFHGFRDSILDRTCFLVFLASLYGIWKLSRTYFVWALCAGLVPALSNCFFSYVRYVLCVFPLFILLGIHVCKPGRRWIFWYYFAFLLCVQAIFMVRYVVRWWAG